MGVGISLTSRGIVTIELSRTTVSKFFRHNLSLHGVSDSIYETGQKSKLGEL